MAGIGVALSGGGHRAALFSLGALLYLADVGKNRDVVCVSSVSGGSLTNGFLSAHTRYQLSTASQLWVDVAPLVQRIANQGTLWGTWHAISYLVFLVAGCADRFRRRRNSTTTGRSTLQRMIASGR